MIARVKDIKTIDSLNIVEFDFNNITLKMMSLEQLKFQTIWSQLQQKFTILLEILIQHQ